MSSFISKGFKEKISASLLLGFSTFIKLIVVFLISRIILSNLGVGQFGKITQFQSLIGIVTVLSGGGITNGIIRYLSESLENNLIKYDGFFNSALKISVFSSIILFGILFVFANQISFHLIGTSDFTFGIRILSLVQILIGFGSFSQAVINSHGNFLILSVGSILGSFFGLVATLCYSQTMNFSGLIIAQILLAFFANSFFFIWILVKRKKYRFKLEYTENNRIYVRKLLKYSIMFLFSVFCLPIAQMLLRSYCANKFGWEMVGYWQGVAKISDAYVQFITIFLGSYFLPKIVKSENTSLLIKELRQTYLIVSITYLVISGFVYLFREQIFSFLYSNKDIPSVLEYLNFYLIGDFFKVLAYIVVYFAISKGALLVIISAEIIQFTLLLTTSSFCINLFGKHGISISYFLTYLIYFILGSIYLKYILKRNDSDDYNCQYIS